MKFPASILIATLVASASFAEQKDPNVLFWKDGVPVTRTGPLPEEWTSKGAGLTVLTLVVILDEKAKDIISARYMPHADTGVIVERAVDGVLKWRSFVLWAGVTHSFYDQTVELSRDGQNVEVLIKGGWLVRQKFTLDTGSFVSRSRLPNK